MDPNYKEIADDLADKLIRTMRACEINFIQSRALAALPADVMSWWEEYKARERDRIAKETRVSPLEELYRKQDLKARARAKLTPEELQALLEK